MSWSDGLHVMVGGVQGMLCLDGWIQLFDRLIYELSVACSSLELLFTPSICIIIVKMDISMVSNDGIVFWCVSQDR